MVTKEEINKALADARYLEKLQIKNIKECERIINDIISEKKVIRFKPSDESIRQLELAARSNDKEILRQVRQNVYDNETVRIDYDIYIPGFLYGTRPGAGYIDSIEAHFDADKNFDGIVINVFDVIAETVIMLREMDVVDSASLLRFIDEFMDKQ